MRARIVRSLLGSDAQVKNCHIQPCNLINNAEMFRKLHTDAKDMFNIGCKYREQLSAAPEKTVISSGKSDQQNY